MSKVRAVLAASVLLVVLFASAGCNVPTLDDVTGTADEAGDASIEASLADDPGLESLAASDGVVIDAAMKVKYVRSLGESQKGAKLYAIIRSTHESQAEAAKALEVTLSSFGEDITYFVAEPTDHLAGLPAGKWVVAEFYRGQPSPEDIDYDSAGMDTAPQVKQVTVTCEDPIPVFEDQMADTETEPAP